MNISDLNDLLEASLETGDYSKLKAIIKKYEHKNIYLYEPEKKALEIYNYFINLNKKIDLIFFSRKDRSAFIRSIQSGNLKKITSYLKKYEDFKVFEWVKEGLIEKVSEALKNGLNPNKKTDNKESLLQIASAFGETEIVDLLLKKGARINPSFFDSEKESPALRVAVYHNQTKTALFLLEHGAKISSKVLSMAIKNQNEPLVQGILNVYQQKYAHNEYESTLFWQSTPALIYAIESGNEKIVKLLLDAGANVNTEGSTLPIKEAFLSRNNTIIDMVYEKADQFQRSQMASMAIHNRLPSIMFHLYQKKCPVFSEDLNHFTIENILGFTFLNNDRATYDMIIKTLSDDEKAKIDWKKAKSLVNDNGHMPDTARNLIVRTFKEVFQEDQKQQEAERKPLYSNPTPCFSVSGNSEAHTDILHATFPTLIAYQKPIFQFTDKERGTREI